MLSKSLFVHCVQRIPMGLLSGPVRPGDEWKNGGLVEMGPEIVVHLVDDENEPSCSLSLRLPQDRSGEFPVGRKFSVEVIEDAAL